LYGLKPENAYIEEALGKLTEETKDAMVVGFSIVKMFYTSVNWCVIARLIFLRESFVCLTATW